MNCKLLHNCTYESRNFMRIEHTLVLNNLFQLNDNRNIDNKQYIVAEEKLTFILRAFKISFVSLDNICFVISWDTKTNLCKYNNIRTKVANYSFKEFKGN